MRWTTSLIAPLALGALGACGEPLEVVAVDPCERALGGAAWEATSTLPEAEGDLEATLLSASTAALPSTLDTSGLYFMNTALLAYALEVPEALVTPALARTRTASVHPRLGTGVLASFESGALDADLLRRVVHRYYACDRAHPVTRDDFRNMYGDYRQFPSRVVEYSVAKQTARTLYESPAAGVYVAENIGEDGEIETEVILEGHRKDGALDFLVYDGHGLLRDRVPLAIGSTKQLMPTPFACMNCHRNIVTNKIDVVDP